MAAFLVADCVTVNSRHVVLSLLVDRLTSRRWLPMSLNDDNRPSTRHHSEMTKMGCRSSEGVGWGICGSFLAVVVLFFFVCLWFRDDLPKFLDHMCPCTLLLFFAYAIVRTEPSATSAKPEEKKKPVV